MPLRAATTQTNHKVALEGLSQNPCIFYGKETHFSRIAHGFIIEIVMPFPIRTCVACGEEFELRPDKPGFANRCPACSEPDAEEPNSKGSLSASDPELNAARRKTIRDMLYRKES